MVGAVPPPGLLFGLGLLSPDGWCHVFLKWQPPGEFTLIINPKTFSSNVLSPTVSHSHSLFFTGDRQRTAGRSDPDSCGVSALPWDPVHTKTCAPFKSGVSISPSPMVLLCISPDDPESQMLQGLLLPILDPQVWKPDVGLRTLTPMGEPL